MMRNSYLMLALLCLVSCASAPSFQSIDDIYLTKKRAVEKYGEGEYFIFYSMYRMTEEEVKSGYKSYFEFVANEIKKQNICNDEYEIVKPSLSKYEGGSTSIYIKCT